MNPEQENFQIIEQNLNSDLSFQNKLEQQHSVESLDVVSVYEGKKQDIQEEINRISDKIKSVSLGIQQVRNRLGLPDTGEVSPSIVALTQKEEELQKEKIKISANYPGDWTLLLQERMLDPVTKQKFIETRTHAMQNMKPGEIPQKDGISLIKPEDYQVYYQKQIDEYDANVKRIFDRTNIGNASEYSKEAHHLGKGETGTEGVVFTNGEKLNGSKLSVREKNIIESHEKGHGLRDFVSEDQFDFRQSIDFEVIRQRDAQTGKREIGYLRNAEEIAERMAQLKNYFGFKAGDFFTKQHLEYAKQHYIQDVGLDNNMTTFFDAITDHTMDKFIETINKYAL